MLTRCLLWNCSRCWFYWWCSGNLYCCIML